MNIGRLGLVLGILCVFQGDLLASGQEAEGAKPDGEQAAQAEEAQQAGGEMTLSDLAGTPQPDGVAPDAGTATGTATPGNDDPDGAGRGQEPAPFSQPVQADHSSPIVSYGSRDKLVLEEIPERFEGPKKYTLSVAGGLTRFDELDGIMATSNGVQEYYTFAPSFRFQVGRQFASQVQVQLELGYARYRGFALAEDGSVSGDVLEAKAFPGSISLSYRFDYFDEQAVVPYFGAGLSGVVGTFTDFEDALTSTSDTTDTGSEETTDTGTTESADGSSSSTTAIQTGSAGTRLGAYLGFGIEFLLDVFEPERASDLELASGVDDSYLVLDVRYYWLDRYFQDATLMQDKDQIPYNGLQVTAGLKFDF